MKWLYALGLCTLSLAASAETLDIAQEAGSPQAQFDDLRYRLGFDVYLANKNLPAAWQVAKKAVSVEPNNLFWLERFAQVSEWLGKPEEALPIWLRYAQKTGQQSAWDNVKRLAIGLYDDKALLIYQQRQVGLKPNDAAEIETLVQIYERLGESVAGLDFLAQLRHKSQAKRALLTAEANLAERAGQDERAINAYSQLISLFKPVDQTWLLRRAALWYQRGKLVEAWQSLSELEHHMPDRAQDYWHTYAELSRLLNKTDIAQRAYQKLTEEFLFVDGDLINYATLETEKNPLNAAFLSELSYRLYKRDNAVLSLLYAYQKANYPQGIERFLSLLTTEELQKFEQNPLFLEQRGQFYWQQKQLVKAQADFELALKLAPKQSRLLNALVGVLIEQNKRTDLNTVLQAAHRQAQRQAALWQVWANGWLFLQKPQKALPFQYAYYQSNPQDSLAGLNLAELLANTGATQQAQALQQQIWQQRQQHIQQETGARLQQLQQQLFALQLNQQTGDASQLLLAQHLRHHAYQQFEHEIYLGWLLNHQHNDRAQQLITQHAHKSTPSWASLNLALQQQDQLQLNHLLSNQLANLPIYDRIEAAMRVNRADLAEDLAFNTQDDYPNDDELHRRYRDLFSERGHSVDISHKQQELGALQRQNTTVSWTTPLNKDWRLQADIEQNQYQSLDQSIFSNDLASQQRLAFTAMYHRQQQQISVQIQQWQHELGWAIKQQYKLDSRLSLGWQWQQQQTSEDSTALLVAGKKNRLAVNGTWNISGREYLLVDIAQDDYLTQYGDNLGSGQISQLQVGHRLFADQLDHVLKLGYSLGQFSTNTQNLDQRLSSLTVAGQSLNSQFYIPQDYQQWSLMWAFGQVNPQQYQRGWRVLGELGFNHANTNGLGFAGQLGIQGSIFGNDRLLLQLQRSQSGQQNGEQGQTWQLSYRLFY